MISRVFAMARPGRPAVERATVIAAARQLAPGMSARRAAELIARRVAAAVVRDIETADSDNLILQLDQLASILTPGPVTTLATCPDIDSAALVRRHRLAAFEARGCRHLRETEWAAERAGLIQALTATLTQRYARHLRARA